MALATVLPAVTAAQEKPPATKPPAADAKAPQDAASVLEAVRQGMGKQLPTRVELSASGSGYVSAPDAKAPQQQYRVESYVLQLDLTAGTASERMERAAPAAPDAKTTAKAEADTREITARSPWSEQHVLWSNPLGFLAAAAARPPSLRSETLLGTPYQVLTVTTPGGEQVQGYVNADNQLERTRTEVGKVPVESVFMSWQDFDGLMFPSLIIQKENGQLSRVLVVADIEHGGGAAPSAGQGKGAK
jgi:hypothetical protein